MTWDGNGVGFNFRGSSGGTADPASDVYVLPTDTYPTTRSNAEGVSVTFGWDTAVSGVDRGQIGGELFGIHYMAGGRSFRVDLPASAEYELRVALGDVYGNAVDWHVSDGTTQRVAWTGLITGYYYRDAGNTDRNISDWGASNTPVTLDFTSGTLFLVSDTPTNYSDVVAHLHLVQGASIGGSPAATGAYPGLMMRRRHG